MTNFASFEHPRKTLLFIVVILGGNIIRNTDDGIDILSIDLQPSKALLSNFTSAFPNHISKTELIYSIIAFTIFCTFYKIDLLNGEKKYSPHFPISGQTLYH